MRWAWGRATESSVEVLYRRHRDAVLKFLLTASRGDATVAEDLVSETFFKVINTYEDRLDRMTDSEVQKLLITAAKSRLIDLWRKDTGLVFWEGYAEAVVPLAVTAGVDQVDRVVGREFVSSFAEVASKLLTDGEWRVAFMTWVMDKSDREIAEELGTTVRTVQTHRSSARKRLKAAARYDGTVLRFADSEADQDSPSTDGIGEVTV
jgi:RNA polymerase sigma factor (sigma-70 family)